jgi:hypothetical protein
MPLGKIVVTLVVTTILILIAIELSAEIRWMLDFVRRPEEPVGGNQTTGQVTDR